MLKSIISRFPGVCKETGKKFAKGSFIYFDTVTRYIYLPESKTAQSYQDAENTRQFIQAEETAYLDNITGGYYSYTGPEDRQPW